MKKLLMVLMSTLVLTACQSDTITEVENSGEHRFEGVTGTVKIITDNETGCKYIYIKEGVGQNRTMTMTSLIKEDGTVDCSK